MNTEPSPTSSPTPSRSGSPEASAGSPEASADYTDIVHLLSRQLPAATVTGPDADGAYTWVFNPPSAPPGASDSH